MGLLDFFKKKKEGYEPSAVELIERDRVRAERKVLQDARMAAELRILNKEAQLKELELDAEIMELENEIYGDENELNPDDLFKDFLKNMMSKTQQPQNLNNKPLIDTNNLKKEAVETLTDDELKTIWKEVPKYQKVLAKTFSDDKIKEFIISKRPNVSADTIERAIKIVRS